MCNLGYCYYYGRDMEINYEKAYDCFSRSAFLGNANAMYKLGDMFFYGYYGYLYKPALRGPTSEFFVMRGRRDAA
uniref:Sel1 repeat protein n=1 Tax=uncultured bacterium contig00025 TaxID=1181514 RepID=A0A806K0X0_9BACT|nr:hypothetical protein [uncultured bacterium contig00025]